MAHCAPLTLSPATPSFLGVMKVSLRPTLQHSPTALAGAPPPPGLKPEAQVSLSEPLPGLPGAREPFTINTAGMSSSNPKHSTSQQQQQQAKSACGSLTAPGAAQAARGHRAQGHAGSCPQGQPSPLGLAAALWGLRQKRSSPSPPAWAFQLEMLPGNEPGGFCMPSRGSFPQPQPLPIKRSPRRKEGTQQCAPWGPNQAS